MSDYDLVSRPAAALSIAEPKRLYLEIRQSAAFASAIDAMAQRAIDEGELEPEQLEHLSVLTARLREDLEALKFAIGDVKGGGHHE